MTLAHFGTFDVDNYGDCLYPLLLERRLEKGRIKSLHISPRGLRTCWPDSAPTLSLAQAMACSREFGAALLGGGHIVRALPTSLPFYNYSDLSGRLVYPSLWLSASALGDRNNIPLCWNAPGVPRPISGHFSGLLKCALSNSQYVAVRDRHSWENLLSSRISQQIHVVPDTALGVSDLWSSDDLDASYQALFQQQRRHLPERTVVFTLKKKYAPEPPDELAKRLDRIASSLRASPLLLVLGPCHSDDEIALAVADHMTTSPLVRVPRTLREAAACIRNAQLYVGSSLHGGITAISFRTPTVLVADEEKVGFRKFSGFLAHVGLPDALCASWQTAERYINLGIPQRSSPTRLNQAFATLDEHWATLYDVLTLGTGCAKHTRLHYGPPPLLDETERCSTQRFDLGTAADHYSNGSIGTSGDSTLPSARETPLNEWLRERCLPTVDLIICVHNALEELQQCLESVLNHTNVPYTLHLINDGSNRTTTEYVAAYALKHGAAITATASPTGYTKAANTGLRNSRADVVVLLNSDTVVSPGWLDNLLECAYSDDRIGIVRPLSNAAAYQSVPFTKNAHRQWVTNVLPAGLSPALANTIVERLSDRTFPRVPFLNGFCMLLKRGVLSRVGYFDETAFPLGYGEEIDYCIRAAKAGFELAVADHVFLYHVKSASYGHARRKTLSAAARERLDVKHGAATMSTARAIIDDNQELALIRNRIRVAFEQHSAGRADG